MTLPPLTYLSVDAMTDGVGASQVLPYVERLARKGMDVTLHSLEKADPSPAIAHRLEEAGVTWKPHRWGRGGRFAGLARMVRGATYLRGAILVHARSDIPAGSALLTRCPAWVWDMRGFWADERIESGLLRPGSSEEKVMRLIERRSARSASGIVTLTATAIDELERRHGRSVRDKARVITTCVELDRFTCSPVPSLPPLRVMIAGTLSQRYDLPLMLDLVKTLRRRVPVELVVLVPGPSVWDEFLARYGAPTRATSREEMPAEVAACHAGLSLLKMNGGVSLKASMPTKVGEFLASGRPVVANAGLGDLDELLRGFDCGVIIDSSEPAELEHAAGEILRLVADPGTPHRCRRLAEQHFSLDTGVEALMQLYRRALEA